MSQIGNEYKIPFILKRLYPIKIKIRLTVIFDKTRIAVFFESFFEMYAGSRIFKLYKLLEIKRIFEA